MQVHAVHETGAHPRPRLTKSWFALWVIIALVLLATFDRQIISLVAPPMVKSLGLTDREFGLVQGVSFGVFTVAAAYPLGWLSDRIDRRLVIGICLVIWSCGTVACGLVNSFGQLFLASTAIAAGEAGLWPIAFSLVPDLFPPDRRVRANLIFYTASILGSSFSFLLGGAAIHLIEEWHSNLPNVLSGMEPWRLLFICAGLPAPIFLLLICFASLTRGAHETLVAPIAGTGMLGFVRVHGRTLLLLVAAIGMFGFAFGGLLAWTPLMATRLFAVQTDSNGIAISIAVGLGCVFGVIGAGLLMRRLKPRLKARSAVRICWLTMMLAAPVILALLVVSSAWQLYTLLTLEMAFGTLVGSLIPTLLQSVAAAHLRARVLALYTIVYYPTVGASVYLTGIMSDELGQGPRALPLAIASVSLFGWLAASVLMRAAELPF